MGNVSRQISVRLNESDWCGGTLEGGVMGDFGKLMIMFGAILCIAGLIFVALGRTHLPLGHLPGDIYYRGKNFTFYFPLMTCVLLSVVFSLIFYLVNHFRH
jgi:hypothetical protein